MCVPAIYRTIQCQWTPSRLHLARNNKRQSMRLSRTHRRGMRNWLTFRGRQLQLTQLRLHNHSWQFQIITICFLPSSSHCCNLYESSSQGQWLHLPCTASVAEETTPPQYQSVERFRGAGSRFASRPMGSNPARIRSNEKSHPIKVFCSFCKVTSKP